MSMGSSDEGSEPPAQESPSAFVSVRASLARVLDAIVEAEGGLARQWSERFPIEEYSSVLEVEQQHVGSFLAEVQRTVASNDARLSEAGTSPRLANFPPTPEQVSRWRSDDHDIQIWRAQSAGLVTAISLMLEALESLGSPRSFEFSSDAGSKIEFEPARSASLLAHARLVEEILYEAVISGNRLLGADDSASTEETEQESQRAPMRGVALTTLLGLPHARLLYAVRLVSVSNVELSECGQRLLSNARRELTRWAKGDFASGAVALVMASHLLGVINPESRSPYTSGGDVDAGTAEPGPLK